MKINLTRCDRPGCGIEFKETRIAVSVQIRYPPHGNMGTAEWDLCNKCLKELEDARRETDLSFGDRLRKEG